MAKKTKGSLIRLVSTGKKEVIDCITGAKTEVSTGYFVVRSKNPKGEKAAKKIELIKYDPRIKKHVLFKEAKIK